MATTSAVLDADFIQKFEDIRRYDPMQFFQMLMKKLDCAPVVHPYVYYEELFSCPLAKQLVETNALRVVEYPEFMPEEDRAHYQKLFENLHQILMSRDKGPSLTGHENIFTHHAGRSFGEVHSVLMAVEMGIPIFYSNDHSGKVLCKRYPSQRLRSLTIQDIYKQVNGSKSMPGTGKVWKALLST